MLKIKKDKTIAGGGVAVLAHLVGDAVWGLGA